MRVRNGWLVFTNMAPVTGIYRIDGGFIVSYETIKELRSYRRYPKIRTKRGFELTKRAARAALGGFVRSRFT